jgi:hypothetical protein
MPEVIDGNCDYFDLECKNRDCLTCDEKIRTMLDNYAFQPDAGGWVISVEDALKVIQFILSDVNP